MPAWTLQHKCKGTYEEQNKYKKHTSDTYLYTPTQEKRCTSVVKKKGKEYVHRFSHKAKKKSKHEYS